MIFSCFWVKLIFKWESQNLLAPPLRVPDIEFFVEKRENLVAGTERRRGDMSHDCFHKRILPNEKNGMDLSRGGLIPVKEYRLRKRKFRRLYVAEEMNQLVRRARKGDTAAASELLRSAYRPVYSYLLRLCGSESTAEDLVQDTFVKVWSALPSFRGECAVTTWIHRIAYTTYIDWYRSCKRDTVVCNSWVDECPYPHPDPSEDFSQRQEALRLYQAVEALDEHLRQVIYLHYYQELPLRETAYVLQIAVSTVKYRLRKAIELLKPLLDD